MSFHLELLLIDENDVSFHLELTLVNALTMSTISYSHQISLKNILLWHRCNINLSFRTELSLHFVQFINLNIIKAFFALLVTDLHQTLSYTSNIIAINM